jgi:branched-chain amino acid transport system ATP-binding protein
MLEIRDLSVHYGEAQILRGISIVVKDGEIVTLIGSNGAGKTTTLRTISGLKKATSGAIIFKRQNIQSCSPEQIVKMGIGAVPQGRNLFSYMTVLENLKLGAYLRKDNTGIKEDLENVFRSFPVLKSRKGQSAKTLSGGEQQMLAIGRALMGKPSMLLLDEPSTGLAPIVLREIVKVIVEINKTGTGILFVEQNARLALRVAQHGYVLETGKVVLQGNCKELSKDERVKEAYLGQ